LTYANVIEYKSIISIRFGAKYDIATRKLDNAKEHRRV